MKGVGLMIEEGDIVRVKDCDTVPRVFRGYIGVVKVRSERLLVEFSRVSHSMITHHFLPNELVRIGKTEGEWK